MLRWPAAAPRTSVLERDGRPSAVIAAVASATLHPVAWHMVDGEEPLLVVDVDPVSSADDPSGVAPVVSAVDAVAAALGLAQWTTDDHLGVPVVAGVVVEIAPPQYRVLIGGRTWLEQAATGVGPWGEDFGRTATCHLGVASLSEHAAGAADIEERFCASLERGYAAIAEVDLRVLAVA